MIMEEKNLSLILSSIDRTKYLNTLFLVSLALQSSLVVLLNSSSYNPVLFFVMDFKPEGKMQNSV